MSNMHEIKTRIRGIKETMQITRAMKLISAAKLKKARQQLDQTLPYFNKIKTTIADILRHSGNVESLYFDLRHDKICRRKAYLIITGDKSLAGGYNHNIISFAEEKIKEGQIALDAAAAEKIDNLSHWQLSQGDNVCDPELPVLFVAGQIGKLHFLKGKKYNVNDEFDFVVHNPTVFRAREIAERLLSLFEKGEVDEVDLVYTHMVSTLKHEPVMIKLLPVDPSELKVDGTEGSQQDESIDDSIMYEPSPEKVMHILITKYLKGIVYGALVESFTCEHSARMTAMDSATSNAEEMIGKLNLYYNRARQAAITQEISEIVGGASALN